MMGPSGKIPEFAWMVTVRHEFGASGKVVEVTEPIAFAEMPEWASELWRTRFFEMEMRRRESRSSEPGRLPGALRKSGPALNARFGEAGE
jgi:hypothetical protein